MKSLLNHFTVVSIIALNFILPNINAQVEFGPQQIISLSADGAESVYCSDLDGDGDLDVLSASYWDNKIAWYENDGNGNFGPENVISLFAEDATSVYSVDIDGDGDMDVLSITLILIAWYENDGDGNFGAQNVKSVETNSGTCVYSADLNGDGHMDVLSANQIENEIDWYANDGSGNFGSQNVISPNTSLAMSVFSADLDGDGDMDVLSASFWDDKIAWYENDGDGNFESQNVISFNADGANAAYSADLDGDGDMDVLSASETDDKIAWYENDGTGNFGLQNVISFDADGPQFVFSIDLDLDGDMDVLSASKNDDKIAWYENDGNGNFGIQNVISVSADSGQAVYCADMDGDGDPDVVSASRNDDKIAWYENLSESGCTDVTACNYDPEAIANDGSCCFGICGCTDLNAINYNSESDCNDQSCLYLITGHAFYDENENGLWDISEYGLPNQQIILHPAENVSFTNDEGLFSFVGQGEGMYSLELILEENFPYSTTTNPTPIQITYNELNEDVIFGISSEFPAFELTVDVYAPGAGYPCNDWVNHNICLRNEGNVPIAGFVELEYNSLFQDFIEITPIDSVVNNKIYMSYENLLPGQMFFYNVQLLSPTVDYIGEFVSSTAKAYGFYDGEQVAYGEKTITVEMTCSYDPNDKQVFPNGYEEPHFILNDTELEYLIRFQNTGNATAINVLVTDTIDENIDLSSFNLVANSHSVITNIRPDERVIEFLFENIMLPDSSSNEPESNGMISFKISPYSDLLPGTVINNTGNIYFDNNPPIITNTTWNTIYECTQALATIEGELVYCAGETVSFQNTQQYVEQYQWIEDNEILGEESVLSTTLNENGIVTIILEASNPLCIARDSVDVLVNPLPDASFTLSGNFLTAAEGAAYQWYLNGTAIPGANNQIYEISEDGAYSVQISNEFGCTEFSQESFAAYVGIFELTDEYFQVYPIPVERGGLLYLSAPNLTNISYVRIYDGSGKTVFESNVVTPQIYIGDWTSGNYLLEIGTGERKFAKNIVVK